MGGTVEEASLCVFDVYPGPEYLTTVHLAQQHPDKNSLLEGNYSRNPWIRFGD